MPLLRSVALHSTQAMLIFGCAALLLALVGGGPTDRLVVRLLVEYPLLLLATAIGTLVINLIAAACGSLAGGSALLAAALGGLLGWAVSGGGATAFAGLGYNALLQPAYAFAIAAPWLLAPIAKPA